MVAQFPALSTALIAKAKLVPGLISPISHRNVSDSPASLIAGTISVVIMEWFVPVLANAKISRTSLILRPTTSSYLDTIKEKNESGCTIAFGMLCVCFFNTHLTLLLNKGSKVKLNFHLIYLCN